MAVRVCWLRVTRRLGRLAGVAVLAGVAGGCSLGGGGGSPSTTTVPPTTAPPATTTTLPVSGPQSSGPRTVLSPIGINVRKAPGKSAPVVGTAAQGVTLTVLGYTANDGGWLKVKGATVTGWISAQPALSAPGVYRSYTSGAFGALFPATWRASRLPKTSKTVSSVLFRPVSGAGDIVATAGGSLSELPDGRVGYGVERSSQVVVCGITSDLVVLARAPGSSTSTTAPPSTAATSSTTAPSSSPAPASLAYLAQVRFAVNKHRALAFYADLPELGRTFETFKEFLAGVTFSSPVC